ncbi:hypothetical protein OG756_42365 (plasmid) [Streptomyces sp. NBC_01310]|uniref:hypothetical protein n=1 Tax=Streptomyces sp. NBC_01310 TaxID=2903820 RepID=UPI0035B59075|nr:hypothetical protein OG756_42365 [Streptomyces sp. NBC_01310]
MSEATTSRKGISTIGMPPGVNAAEWIVSDDGLYGTDGRRMYRRIPGGEDRPQWSLMLDSHVRMTTVRYPVADPDFPERSEEAGEDTPESGADIEVTTSPKRGGLTRVYRNVTTTDMVAMKPLTWAGPDAWRGTKLTQAIRADIAAGVNMLADEYPGGIERAPFYTVTGWHTDPVTGREMFVHGAGAIDANGARPDVTVQVDSRIARFCFADPASGAELYDAFDVVMGLMECMAPKVIMPLLAATFRSPFGVYRGANSTDSYSTPTPWLVGNTGDGKSGAMASAINTQAPSVTYNSLPIKAGSTKSGGASGPGLERLLYAGRDLVLPMDDVDPSDPTRAQWQSNYLRSVADQKGRLLAENGKSNRARAERPCRAMGMGTGEPMDAEASAENRAVNISLVKGDVNRSALRDATGPDERVKRAEFLAGIIQILAGDRPRYRARLAAARVALRPMFAAGDVPGPVDRGADSFAELAATWWVVLGLLVENAGMSRGEARTWWGQVRDGLTEAWLGHLSVIGAGDRASRAIGYLREALESGRAHVASVQQPAGPPAHPSLTGWERTTDAERPWVPRGEKIGWQDDEKGLMYLLPSIATGALRTVADRADDQWTGSTKTLGATFRAGNFLRVTESRERRGEFGGPGPVLGDKSRPSNVWHISIAAMEAAGEGLYRPAEYAGAPAYASIPGPHIPPYEDGQEDGPEAVADPQGPAPAAPVLAVVPAPSAPVAPVTELSAAVLAPSEPADGDHQEQGAEAVLPRPRRGSPRAEVPSGRTSAWVCIYTDQGLTGPDGAPVEGGEGSLGAALHAAVTAAPAGTVAQVVIDPAAHAALGIRGRLPRPGAGGKPARTPKFVTELRAAGWLGRSKDGSVPVRACNVFVHEEHPDAVVHVMVRHWLTTDGGAWGEKDEPSTVWAGRLARVSELVGHPWGPTDGKSAADLHMSIVRDKSLRHYRKWPMWQAPGGDWLKAVGNAADCSNLDWTAPEQGDMPFRHQYDARYNYLSSYAEPRAMDPLTHTGARAFDKGMDGLWLIERPAWDRPGLPAPWAAMGQGAEGEGPVWVTTSVAVLTAEQGLPVVVLDSWTSARYPMPGGEEFVARVRDALKVAEVEGDPYVVGALKQLYRSLHGVWKRGPYPHRPDWFAAVKTDAATRILRKVYRVHADTGRTPLRIQVDAVVYGSQQEDPMADIPPLNGKRPVIGDQLGQFKVKGEKN